MGSTFCKAEPYCCLDGPLGTQVNLTYAFDMGNYWCFDGFPEYMGWNITNTTTNGTNVTNGTGTPTIPVLPTNIVVPSYVPWKPTPDWLNNITNGTIDDLNLQYYEDIYNFTTIPTLLNAIFGSICVIVCVLVVITYIFIAIYQPVMYASRRSDVINPLTSALLQQCQAMLSTSQHCSVLCRFSLFSLSSSYEYLQ